MMLKQYSNYLSFNGFRFHHVWLYEHCLCERCHHHSSYQKKKDVASYTILPAIRNVFVENNRLIIVWDETPSHISQFSEFWLRNHAYDLSHNDNDNESSEYLWCHSDLSELIEKPITYKTANFSKWMDQLNKVGFCLFKNIPHNQFKDFVTSIGPVYELGNYGKFSSVKAIRNAPDLSLAAEGNMLSPHTDMTYLPAPRVAQFQYCVANDATGGESIISDGFRIARDFRQEHEEYFKILSTKPVEYWQLFRGWKYRVSNRTPVIETGENGDIKKICFSNKNLGPNINFSDVEAFYKAYYAFSKFISDPRYSYSFRLEPGDCLLLQNFRILHGRNAFDVRSGNRHLEVGYVEWSYFLGRQEFYKTSHSYDNDY